MQDMPKGFLSSDKLSGGFFLALMEAGKGECACEVCKILRNITDEMKKNYMK